MGVLGLKEGRAAVIEYFELDDSLRQMQDAKGHLIYGLANLGLFLFVLAVYSHDQLSCASFALRKSR